MLEGKILLFGRDEAELNPYERMAAKRGRLETPMVRIDPRSSGEHLELCRGHRPIAVLVRSDDIQFVLPAVREGFRHVIYLNERRFGGNRIGGTLFALDENGKAVSIAVSRC